MPAFLAQIKAAPGREHEQAFIRILIGLLIFVVVFTHHFDDPAISKLITIQLILYTLIGCLLLFWIYKDPNKNSLRYVVSSGIDTTALSCLLYYSGSMGVVFYSIYLWVVFGFGFRFGAPYLFVAAGQSIIGFIVVYLTSSYWSSHTTLFYSFLISLIILPAYVSTLLTRLKHSIEKANVANDAKSQFLANMSHELRTPLNGIFCSNDLLRTTNLSDSQEEYVDSIEYSVNVLHTLINDILDLSKIESGKFESVDEDFDLHVLLNSAVIMLKNHAQEKGLELHMHVNPDVPFSLYGDKSHTLQVLINIVGNAIKYTQSGEVNINTRLNYREENECRIHFEIKDTGSGIPLDQQDTIFDRFTQADKSDTRQHNGVGLGATIAKDLVEQLGGTIGFDSEVDKGTTFWFELPYKVRKTDKNADDSLKNVRVLILRDKDNLLEDIYQDLKNWKVTIVDVFTPNQAIKAIDQSNKDKVPLHAIIIAKSTLEINLPEFTNLLKSKSILDSINLIFINDEIIEEAKKDIYASGVDYVLPRIVEKSVLFNAIHSSPLLIPKDETIKVYSHHKKFNSSKSIKILIAEDNPANQYLFKRILTYSGFEVTIANDGQEAIDELNKQSYDLCLMDMQMPIMSGVQAIKLYRYLVPESTMPFIILTANATQEATKACKETGAEAYLTKPIRAHILVDKIHELIDIKVKDTVRIKKPGRNNIVLDYEQITFSDDKDTIEKMITVFKENLLTNLEKLNEAVNEKDYSEYKTALHSIKGISGNFGAIQLYNVIIRAEKTSHSEFLHDVTPQVEHITKEIHLACKALQDYSGSLV